MAQHRIYVPLADNSTELRETEGEAMGEGRFRLSGRPAPSERWQFTPGEIVECADKELGNGSRGLVAVLSLSADPEYRKRRTVYGIAGGVFGAIVGAWFEFSSASGIRSMAVAAGIGAVVFAFLSVRGRDAAWRALSWWTSLGWWPRGW
jgi:hypothetical protein